MKTAIAVTVLTGVLVGLYMQARPATPSNVSEPVPQIATTDCQAVLRSMEDAKQQIAAQRQFITVYHNWAPVEAGVCFRLLDEIDVQIGAVEGRAIHGEPIELGTLQRLLDQFHLAGLEFKKAAQRR